MELGPETRVVGGVERTKRYNTVMRRSSQRRGMQREKSNTISTQSTVEYQETITTSTSGHDVMTDEDLRMQYKLGLTLSEDAEKTTTKPKRKREKIQDKLWDVSASFDRRLTTAQNALKFNKSMPRLRTKSPAPDTEFEIDTFFYHNPPGTCPQYDNRAPSTVSSKAESLYRSITGRSRSSRQRPSLSRLGENESSIFDKIEQQQGSFKNEAITNWVEASTAGRERFGVNDEYFMACTPTQLQELNHETLERVRVVKAYIGPPTSPVSEPSDGFDVDFSFPNRKRPDRLRMDPYTGLTNLTINDINNYRDFVPVEPGSIHATLARSLGLRSTGIQVLGTSLPNAHDRHENMSPYYFEPYLEAADKTRKYCYSPPSERRISFNDGREWEDDPVQTVTFVPKNMGVREETVSKVWFRKRDFVPKQTQRPAKSLILYLLGKGHAADMIADMVSGLDEKFVTEWRSRWWNGLRIPEHWEFDDGMVEKVQVACRAEKGWWEEELGMDSVAIKMMRKARRRKARAAVKRCVEEYLWWRLRGGEKLGNDGGVYGTVGSTAVVGFQSMPLPRLSG